MNDVGYLQEHLTTSCETQNWKLRLNFSSLSYWWLSFPCAFVLEKLHAIAKKTTRTNKEKTISHAIVLQKKKNPHSVHLLSRCCKR